QLPAKLRRADEWPSPRRIAHARSTPRRLVSRAAPWAERKAPPPRRLSLRTDARHDPNLSPRARTSARARWAAGAPREACDGRAERVLRGALGVRGVVSAEMSASWPAAALEAQAVATRTYALTAHAGGSRFDVYADTRSQVYAGPAAYTAATNAAVAATAGQIVTYAGAPAITYF